MMTLPGGVKVIPNPPQAGGQVTISVQNGAKKITWRIPPDGKEHDVDAPDGKATITVPLSAAGKQLSIYAGDGDDIATDRFTVVDLSAPPP